MIISKLTLPKSIFDKLPISIQNGFQNNFDVDILDMSLIIEIYNYLNTLPTSNIYQDTTNLLDFSFKQSNTNNLTAIVNKVEMLKDHFITYLKTPLGSFPFDPNVGCKIPEYVKLKENALKQELVEAELTRIISSINKSYNSKLVLTDFKINIDENDVANIYITVVFDDGSSLNSVLK